MIPANVHDAVAPGAVVLRARGLGIERNGATLLTDISFEVKRGELLAIIGPNGAGKSTLLGALAGDIEPSAGSVELDGRPLTELAARDVARLRAVLPQQLSIAFPFTVREIVAMGRNPWLDDRDDDVVAAAMQRLDVTHLAERTYPTLSVGEQARTSLARVLAQETPLLLLDEPTAALDIGQQEKMLTITRGLVNEGHAVVAVLHDLNVARRHADKVLVIHAGRSVAYGTPHDVLVADRLSSVYDHPIRVVETRDGTPFITPGD
jgi:iron complex transport system ATP-binding protein